MEDLKKNLFDLYSSEYPTLDKNSHKRLKLNKAVARSFEKRLKILADAIKELNQDIKDREEKGNEVNNRLDEEISHLEFVLKDMEKFPIGQVDLLETRRLGLEKELFGLRQQKRSEHIRVWSDISALKRKRRELIMEYESLLKTREMVS